MNRLPFPLLFLLGVLVSGCAAFGSKTLYRGEVAGTFKRIGFTAIAEEQVGLKTFSDTDSLFEKTLFEALRPYHLEKVVAIPTVLPLNTTAREQIAQICEANGLDGIIVSKLRIIGVNYPTLYTTVMRGMDSEVEMQLFDKDGVLQLDVRHNTGMGNSYFMPPKVTKTIRDALTGGIKKLAKELHWSR